MALKCVEHEDFLQVNEAIYGLEIRGRPDTNLSVCEGVISTIPTEARLEGQADFDVYEVTSTPTSQFSDDASIVGMQWHDRLFGLSKETVRRYLPNAARILLGRRALES